MHLSVRSCLPSASQGTAIDKHQEQATGTVAGHTRNVVGSALKQLQQHAMWHLHTYGIISIEPLLIKTSPAGTASRRVSFAADAALGARMQRV